MVTAAKPKIGGAVSYAPLSATLPTTADGALTGFESVGYISDAGVTRSTDLDNDVIKAWGGDVVLVLDNGKTETFQFAMLDATSVAVLKLVNGEDNVTGETLAAGLTVKSNNSERVGHAFVIDMIESGKTLHRICIPHGVITEVGDVTYVDNEAVAYDVTITAIADSAGQTAYEYLKTAAA